MIPIAHLRKGHYDVFLSEFHVRMLLRHKKLGVSERCRCICICTRKVSVKRTVIVCFSHNQCFVCFNASETRTMSLGMRSFTLTCT